MADIFGDDSDPEIKANDDQDATDMPQGGNSDEDEPKFLRVEEGSDVETQQSDFDLMVFIKFLTFYLLDAKEAC